MWLEYPGLKFTENYFNVPTPFFFAVSSLRKNKEITSNTYIQHQSVLHERTTTNIINLSTLSSNMGRKSVHLSVEEKRAKKAEALTIYTLVWSLQTGGAPPYKNQPQLKFEVRLPNPTVWRGGPRFGG